MHTDHFFRIGHGHAVCQDYAVSGMEPFPYAIVADGCSSSKDSEVGAMLLCRLVSSYAGAYGFSDSDTFEAVLCDRIMALKYSLSLDVQAFDSTLCILHVDLKSNGICLSMWGDGHVLLLKNDGIVDVMSVKYSENAPFYLSYWVDCKRRDQYRDVFCKQKKYLLKNIIFSSDTYHGDIKCELDLLKPYTFWIPVHGYKAVFVASDGFDSFFGKSGINFSVGNILTSMFPLKVTAGAFIQRRMNRLLKNLSKGDIVPLDDVSIAGIWLGDKP